MNLLKNGPALRGAPGGDKGTLRNGFDANFVTKWFAEVLVAGRLLKGQKLALTR